MVVHEPRLYEFLELIPFKDDSRVIFDMYEKYLHAKIRVNSLGK